MSIMNLIITIRIIDGNHLVGLVFFFNLTSSVPQIGFCWCMISFGNLPRYIKSRSDKQLLHGLEYKDTSSCRPEEYNNGLSIVPCGLVAWSLFNDSYTFVRETVELRINRRNIAWKSDREHKFGRNVYPFNFQNGSLIGGGTLDPDVPVSILIVQILYVVLVCTMGRDLTSKVR